MKKFSTTIICIIYFVASSNATINFHYCMGKFVGWDVSANLPETCSNCGMHKEVKKGCCNDKHACFQIKKDQLASSVNIIPQNNFLILQSNQSSFQYRLHYSTATTIQSLHSPPLIYSSSIIIRHCVFRI